ncbi:hypothetical protein NQ318_007107 [Aromia moschata]|uniref:Mos1 transposase HTH domain-containing protein n=1 Tax=Aromia moschata TaxID=1265417 RepID=A0AAV8X910_9CUCU|nr:hypothetical protein NQ318_007107 [Aromia moschata]
MLCVQMEQQMDQKEQHLKFLVKQGKTHTEGYAILKEVYGNEYLFRIQVFEWFKRFKEERETTEDDPRPGRPSTSKTDENIEKNWGHDSSVEAVKAKATEILNQLTEANFQHCFQQWKSCMEQCSDRQGQYIEGEEVASVIIGKE